MGLILKTSTEPKLQNYMKSSLASNSPSIRFFASRSSWDSWNWFQMISHSHNPWVLHQKQVSSMFKTKVTVSLHEVIFCFLQPLHPFLDLQVELRLMKRIPRKDPKWYGIPKKYWVLPFLSKWPSRTSSSLASYSTSIQFLTSRSILGSCRWSPMICHIKKTVFSYQIYAIANSKDLKSVTDVMSHFWC